MYWVFYFVSFIGSDLQDVKLKSHTRYLTIIWYYVKETLKLKSDQMILNNILYQMCFLDLSFYYLVTIAIKVWSINQ